ncbi:four helix bundle protein [Cloacibacterium normanense]|uniref:four helix bundle protein n=1 Tax=Cloacibacterium normanense TaxID=237258 RepID=UPI0035AF2D17
MSDKINSHKDLKVYQEALLLVKDIYCITSNFPKEELYGLTSQMKRCVISIPSNIAEGSGRKGNAELIRFLYISLGSLSELETQLDISIMLNFTKENKDIQNRIYFIKNMLSKLIISLNNKNEG